VVPVVVMVVRRVVVMGALHHRAVGHHVPTVTVVRMFMTRAAVRLHGALLS
jgi:hypothetical protein